MALYFKIATGTTDIIDVLQTANQLQNFNTKEASDGNGKPFLVEAVVTDPAFDPATEVKEGPTDDYDGTNATRVYTVRAKTQQELDDEAEADATSGLNMLGLKTAILYAAERAGDDIIQPAVRQAAFDRAKQIYKAIR